MFQSLFAKIFKAIGNLSVSDARCVRLFLDEPEMPKSMIER